MTARNDIMAQIDALETARRLVAQYNRDLADRRVSARKLKLVVAFKLRSGKRCADGKSWKVAPLTKDEAEKFAGVDPQYLAHEAVTADLELTRDRVEAEAEGLRLRCSLTIAQIYDKAGQP